jgi:hypothetical protein
MTNQPISPTRDSSGGSGSVELSRIYTTDGLKWYEARPYGFQFVESDGKTKNTVYLPILPQNLQISTVFATNLQNTLYGVVEQHSENKFYNISISGTTGIGPQYSGDPSNNTPLSGRRGFVSGDLKSFISKVADFIPAANALGAISDRFMGIFGDSPNETGIYMDNNGYQAFHNFYRFLLEYKRIVAEESKVGIGSRVSPLLFLNYKDGNKYSCIIQSFNLTRSADSPMQYKYNIQIKAYNMTAVDQVTEEDEDEDEDEDGFSFTSITRRANNLATLLSGFV